MVRNKFKNNRAHRSRVCSWVTDSQLIAVFGSSENRTETSTSTKKVEFLEQLSDCYVPCSTKQAVINNNNLLSPGSCDLIQELNP
jgi:hypothetical protein